GLRGYGGGRPDRAAPGPAGRGGGGAAVRPARPPDVLAESLPGRRGRRGPADRGQRRLAPQRTPPAEGRGGGLDRRGGGAAGPGAAHPGSGAVRAARGVLLPSPAEGPARRGSRGPGGGAGRRADGDRGRGGGPGRAGTRRRDAHPPRRHGRARGGPPGRAAGRPGAGAGGRDELMLRIDVVTIFPAMLEAPLADGIVRRAVDAGLVGIDVHDLRAFTDDRHRTVDDAPFGGGPGMVM